MTSTIAPSTAAAKAATLAEALPYIRTYHGRIVVVKVGGAALDDAELAQVVAEDIALMSLVGIRLVVVHGGGPQVSEEMRARGVEPEFVDGLRVTGDAAMEVVRRVLVGSINATLVARLCRAGLQAVGVTGQDAGLVTATAARGPSGETLGRVGRVSEVNPRLLLDMLGGGYTPVVAPVATGVDGGPMNVNADEVAGAVAAALGAAKVVYLTNVQGLYRDLGDSGSLVSELSRRELEAIVPKLSDGMRPKAESAVAALTGGVGKAHILDGRVDHALLLEVFTAAGIGTQVLP